MFRGKLTIKAARAMRGLSQDDLAAETGISQGRISQIELGKVAASDEDRAKIADALGRVMRELEWPTVDEVRA